MGGQLGAVQKDTVGADPQLIRSGEHEARLAHNVEIAQKRIAQDMVVGAAKFLGEGNSRARTRNVGGKAGDDRQAAGAQHSRRLRGRCVQRNRRALDPSRHIPLIHQLPPVSARQLVS
jgi:hypothetical protein